MSQWMAILGIVSAVVGFFWQPITTGVIAVVLGGLVQFTPKLEATANDKKLSWIAIVAGAVALILGII